MSFRGINTTVIQIRRQVFTEVARMAYANVKGEQANHLMRKIPYTIIPGEEGKLRKDIFLERAIVEERVRLAMGLPTRRMDEHNSVVSGLEDASIADKYYDPPLVNVIKFACNRCPEKLVKVSDLCQGCLAHPCMEVCPKKAITWESGRSTIDQEKCIKCGRCVGVCPYNAIVKTERPCAAACGMGAIHSDELGRAEIDYSKCVSCGQCLVNCPFGAIADKGQIYQLIQGFNRGDRIYALVAPAFINQFPGLASTGKLKAALKALGFYDVVEVAIGADLCTVDEAHDFLEEVPNKLNFMATSCCPAWSMMAKTAFPGLAKNISMTMTPMVFTARMMKQADPDARMCFIGPCAAKKLEASRRTVRSDVDFVLTFEELAGIIEAKDLDLEYPGTPTEVVKLFWRINKCLYNTNMKEKDQKALFQQLRRLYDDEFLGQKGNSEEDMYQSLKKDIKKFDDSKNHISSYIVQEDDQVQYAEVKGKEEATLVASVLETSKKSKTTESYAKYICRKDSKEHWKILGWQQITAEEAEKQ